MTKGIRTRNAVSSGHCYYRAIVKMTQQQTVDAKLKSGKMAPLFVLPSTAGDTSGPGAYRSRYNLVLAFLNNSEQACAFLGELAELNSEITLQDGRVLVVIIGTFDEVRTLKAKLALPFPLLTDEGGNVTSRMLGGVISALCVADRYGEVISVEVAPSPGELPSPSTALDWLIFIQSLCPE